MFALFGAIAFPLVSRDAHAEIRTADQLFGCWRRELPRPEVERFRRLHELCLRRDGTAVERSFGDGLGGDDLVAWQFVAGERRLVLDGDRCLVAAAGDSTTMAVERLRVSWRMASHLRNADAGRLRLRRSQGARARAVARSGHPSFETPRAMTRGSSG